jgi:hypothetical protein
MAIAILVLTLTAYGYALIAWPEFRRPGLIAGALAAAGLAVYFSRQAPEAARSGSLIAPEELTLESLSLERTALGADLTGRVLNGSADYRVRDLTLVLSLRDCPAPDTAPADCPVIGESRAIVRPDVPPGQVRALSAHFTFADLPPVLGTLRWDWRIAETRATRD